GDPRGGDHRGHRDRTRDVRRVAGGDPGVQGDPGPAHQPGHQRGDQRPAVRLSRAAITRGVPMPGGEAEGEVGANIVSCGVKDLGRAMWKDTEADATRVTTEEVERATQRAAARIGKDLEGKTEKEIQDALRKEAEEQLKRQLEQQARKLRLPVDSIAFRYR